MALKAADALRLWGSKQFSEPVDIETVKVDIDYEPGYDCCGGADPSCYCSFATGPDLFVSISARTTNGRHVYIELRDFDFITMVNQMVKYAGGIDL